MKKMFFFLISSLIYSSSLFSMDLHIQLENYIKQAEYAEKKGDMDGALQWYGLAAAVNVPERPSFIAPELSYYDKERELQQKGLRKIANAGTKSKAQKKYDEAIKVYKYAGDRFKTEIAQIEALQKAQEPKAVEPEQKEETKEDWIFVTEMPGAKEQKTTFLQVTQDHKFEIAKNESVLYGDTFGEMMQDAKNKNIPFFLVLLRGKDKEGDEVMNVYGGDIFKYLAERWEISNWLNTRLLIEHPDYPPGAAAHYLPAHFLDPLTLLPVSNVTLYVMGDDGKFMLLKDNVTIGDLRSDFVYLTKQPHKENIGGTPTMIYTYEPHSALTRKGDVQYTVASIFENRAQKETDQKEKQELLQHARQWYKWALKYYSPGSADYDFTQGRLKNIVRQLQPEEPEKPKKPEKPQKPTGNQELLLIQSLQNLTNKLQQIPAKLI